MIFQRQDLILFQGDSITDCGRNRLAPNDMGFGYAIMAAAWLSAMRPEHELRFLNRGIGGDRVCDLKRRWTTDCIELKPDWVSIMVGINEVWRRFDSNDPTATEVYERDYREILGQVREALPETRFILIEPFVLETSPDRAAWREDLDSKIAVVRRLANEFSAILIPLDGIFAGAAAKRKPAFWAEDGVHPSPAGHALIAQSWLNAVEAN
ncbi:SGNH/GDSL hydrolase family protein [Candidatus Sumerlaeota bacterium]|nr:SGNH/GDSL hydrolase family protein [Candidatus Sumerlaeota bacterium]